MAKKDDIILIISKSFSKQKLTNKEIGLCKDLSISKLIIDHGLTDVQASCIINWCCMQQRFFKSEEQLQLEDENNLKQAYIAEGIFDFLKKPSKNDDTALRKNLRKMHNPSIDNKNNYVNETIKFINLSTKISAIIRNLSGDSSYELADVSKKVPIDSLNLLKIVRDECTSIYDLLKPKAKAVPSMTSARMNTKKTPWYKKLMFKEDYSASTKDMFLSQLESMLDRVSSYFSKSISTEQSVSLIKQLSVYSDSEINTLLEDLSFTIKTISDFITHEESTNNARFKRSN